MLVVSCQQPVAEQDITKRVLPVKLGTTTVDIVEHQADSAGLTYVHLHDDEDTSVKAVLEVIKNEGGRLIEIQHTGERNVTFSLQDSTYEFDPNRIFSERGREMTLQEFSSAPKAARQEVEAFADSVLRLLDIENVEVVVSVHNNTDNEDDSNYSALSYTDEGDLTKEALFVHVTDEIDPDNFFFVTDRQIYDALRQGGYNVVMQDNARVTDDGSLSVYCGKHGVPYVNVEAQHGRLDYQIKMIAFLEELLTGGEYALEEG